METLTKSNKVAVWVLSSLYASTGIVSPIAIANAELNKGIHLVPYSIVVGDTFYSISQRHGVSVDSLVELNQHAPSPLRSDVIKVGQIIYVPSTLPQVLPQLGDTVTSIDERHSETELFLASQANRIGQSYGQNETSDLQLNEPKYYDSHNGASKSTEASSLSVVEQEANYLKQQVQSAFQTEANEQAKALLGKLGTAEVELHFDNEFHLSGYSADLLAPIVDTSEGVLFVQAGGRHDDISARTIINVGVGRRHFNEDWMFGYNAFFDHDVTRGHNRLGLGAEAWADYLKLSANVYTPLSNWKDSADFDEYLERAARGLDLNAKYYLPQYPQLGLSAKFEQYFGDEVDLLSSKTLERNPYAGTLGLEWQPVPLLKVGVDHRQAKGSQSDTQINVGLEWKIGASLDDMLNPANVAPSRQLQGMRHDLVERNNNIVLEYKEKERTVSIAHVPISGLSGKVETLSPSVSISSGRIESWQWSSPDPLLQGGLSNADIENPTLTLPSLPLDVTKKEFVLYLTVTDERGRSYQSSAIPVTVGADVSSRVSTLSIIDGGTPVADSHTKPSWEVEVGDGAAEFEFVLTHHSVTDEGEYVSVAAREIHVHHYDGKQIYKVTFLPAPPKDSARQPGAPLINRVKVTPLIQGAALPEQTKIRFDAADARGEWGYGHIDITIKTSTTVPTGKPQVSNLSMVGTLELGKSLTATYNFNAKGGDANDKSTYAWGHEGETAADMSSAQTVVASGKVPGHVLAQSDMGEVMEVSVQAKNGLDVTGNTVTLNAKGGASDSDGGTGAGRCYITGGVDTDGDGLGDTVVDPSGIAVTVKFNSSANANQHGVNGIRPVLNQDEMTAMCQLVGESVATECDASKFDIQWYVVMNGGEKDVPGATSPRFTAVDKMYQGQRTFVEVNLKP